MRHQMYLPPKSDTSVSQHELLYNVISVCGTVVTFHTFRGLFLYCNHDLELPVWATLSTFISNNIHFLNWVKLNFPYFLLNLIIVCVEFLHNINPTGLCNYLNIKKYDQQGDNVTLEKHLLNKLFNCISTNRQSSENQAKLNRVNAFFCKSDR